MSGGLRLVGLCGHFASTNRVHRGNLLRSDSLQHKRKTSQRFTGRCVVCDCVLPYRQLPIASIYILPFHSFYSLRPSTLPLFHLSHHPHKSSTRICAERMRSTMVSGYTV